MRVAVRKLQVEDSTKLQTLVAENIDAIEPGLVVLDSRLLLGHTTIDVVGLDANGALVLIAAGLTANEEMLLRAVEAYSWCREYPESLERLYPSCVISDERPPRLIFVVERMPDAFQRKIKQLGFPDVDCVEFRLLEVEGTPAVYFESILRVQRTAPTPVAPAPAEPATETAPSSENVIAINGPAAARATSLKLQKLLNQTATDGTPRASARPTSAVREPAAIVSMVSRQTAVSQSRVEPVTLGDAEPVTTPAPTVTSAPILAVPTLVPQIEPLLVPGPVIVAPEPVIATPAPVVVAPTPAIITPSPIVVPDGVSELDPFAPMPEAELLTEPPALELMDVAPSLEPAVPVEPKLELAVEPEMEPTFEVAVDPVVDAMLTFELAAAPAAAAEPKLELIADEPLTVAEPIIAVRPEPVPAEKTQIETSGWGSEAVIPSLQAPGTNGVPSMGSERVSLRSLPELSLRPSAPVAVPRPTPLAAAAPITAPADAATPPIDAEPRVSFKGLSSSLLSPSVDVEPVLTVPTSPITEAPAPVAAEPASPAMTDAAADLEPALTVEALIRSTLVPDAPDAQAAPVAMAPPAAQPQTSAPAAAPVPLEFEGLKFPNDGVLTRQWMDFLSQMSTTK
jgi:hypothetical protein